MIIVVTCTTEFPLGGPVSSVIWNTLSYSPDDLGTAVCQINCILKMAASRLSRLVLRRVTAMFLV